ncbi:MAG: hypothetical protein K1Y02_26005 [Candidatus Hydrogenedentes bacterium]|nr:hypothetical protein [Candidatus Hydrogenedentota bacterium]
MSTPIPVLGMVAVHVDELRKLLTQMTDEQRLEVFSEIMADYCRHCGRYDGHSTDIMRGCQCWNDE